MRGSPTWTNRQPAMALCGLLCASSLCCASPVGHGVPDAWGITAGNAGILTRSPGKTFFVADSKRVISIDDNGGLAHLIGDGKDDIGSLRCDGTTAYWSLSLESKILSAPAEGGHAPRVLVASQAAGPIALNATHVFYSWPGRILRVSKQGGIPETVVESGGRVRAADDAYAYVVDGEVLERAPVGGGPKTTLARGHAFSDVALDASHVYWIDSKVDARQRMRQGKVFRLAKAGGVAQPLTAVELNPGCLTLEGDRVWFCNGLVNTEAGVVTSQPTISSVPKSGGPITRREMPFQVHGLAADGRWIYLSEFLGPARLRRIPK